MIDKQRVIVLKEAGKTNKEISEILGCSLDWCKKNLRGIKKGKIQLYWVHIAYSKSGLLYVGSWKHGRHKHCISGKSNNKYLNMALFNNEHIIVEVVADNLSKEDSLVL